MNDLKSLLERELRWALDGNRITLTSEGEGVLVLTEEKANHVSFSLDGSHYVIRNEGVWNPRTIIEREGEQLVVIRRQVLGSNATAAFTNGSTYDCRYTNAPLARLTFFSEDGREILYYKLDASIKPITALKIVDPAIDTNELLMLLVLGCYSFIGVVKENVASDLFIMTAATAGD